MSFKIKKYAYRIQKLLSKFPFLFNHRYHVLVDHDGHGEVEGTGGQASHAADQLVVREHALAFQQPIMLDTRASHRQLYTAQNTSVNQLKNDDFCFPQGTIITKIIYASIPL